MSNCVYSLFARDRITNKIVKIPFDKKNDKNLFESNSIATIDRVTTGFIDPNVKLDNTSNISLAQKCFSEKIIDFEYVDFFIKDISKDTYINIDTDDSKFIEVIYKTPNEVSNQFTDLVDNKYATEITNVDLLNQSLDRFLSLVTTDEYLKSSLERDLLVKYIVDQKSRFDVKEDENLFVPIALMDFYQEKELVKRNIKRNKLLESLKTSYKDFRILSTVINEYLNKDYKIYLTKMNDARKIALNNYAKLEEEKEHIMDIEVNHNFHNEENTIDEGGRGYQKVITKRPTPQSYYNDTIESADQAYKEKGTIMEDVSLDYVVNNFTKEDAERYGIDLNQYRNYVNKAIN